MNYIKTTNISTKLTTSLILILIIMGFALQYKWNRASSNKDIIYFFYIILAFVVCAFIVIMGGGLGTIGVKMLDQNTSERKSGIVYAIPLLGCGVVVPLILYLLVVKVLKG